MFKGSNESTMPTSHYFSKYLVKVPNGNIGCLWSIAFPPAFPCILISFPPQVENFKTVPFHSHAIKQPFVALKIAHCCLLRNPLQNNDKAVTPRATCSRNEMISTSACLILYYTREGVTAALLCLQNN